jgi:CRP-like cAMP-binding protein
MTVLPHPQPAATADPAKLVALLQRSLPGASPSSLQLLAETARIRTVTPGDMITGQGEQIQMTLFITGYGAFRRTTISGQQLIMGVADPGYLFGFTSVVGLPSSVAVQALTTAEVATWSGPELRELAARDPGLAIAVIETLARFLSVLTEKVDGFLHQDARQRVIRILGRHRDLFFSDPAILSRSHLPALVGTTREMTGRVLRELERDGTVARDGATGLRLLRPDRLDAHITEMSDRAG